MSRYVCKPAEKELKSPINVRVRFSDGIVKRQRVTGALPLKKRPQFDHISKRAIDKMYGRNRQVH